MDKLQTQYIITKTNGNMAKTECRLTAINPGLMLHLFVLDKTANGLRMTNKKD